MNRVTLSIDELIYGFYSEGLFEQAIGLRQTFFEELNDDQFELVLQTSCRSLLSKDLLVYDEHDHRFQLTEESSSLIKSLNYSPLSLKFSRFEADGGQDSISIHLPGGKGICHSVIHEGQVHVFDILSQGEILLKLKEYFSLKDSGNDSNKILELKQAEFEEMLTLAEQQPSSLEAYLRTLSNHSEASLFANAVSYNKGKMNSMLVLGFDDKKEPDIEDVLFVICDPVSSWVIKKNEQTYEVLSGGRNVLSDLVESRIVGLNSFSV
ncbi:hypothetical protein [Fictibacillus terranigra]|uniref:Uncharacterized protein n=1 Tax=Fictibacillus terranigra TaxID=3058424 RepID=A0ABT8EDC4_9BACL|nr:hypothetical protein [Fictibacillus sp. CENA-BCM004]MDN4075891.1 hypothetical protein [Fictibacillus sp. CENA-BCM004]